MIGEDVPAILREILAMPSAELFLREADTGEPVRLAPDHTISLSSEHAGWDGIAVERQRLPGCVADGYMAWHLLSVQLTPPEHYEDAELGPVPVRHGDVIIRPAGAVTSAMWQGTPDVVNVAIDPAAIARVAAEMTDGPAVALDRSWFGPDPHARHLALVLQDELAPPHAGPAGRLLADSVRTALAAHLVARHGHPVRRTDRRRVLTAHELAQVRERVDADLAGDLRLADLAAAVALSPYHFSRLFTATTGQTPYQFVLQKRIARAKVLLGRRGVTVRGVARRTGFADAGHLARHFRRHVGTTPALYAAALRDR
jgi:AraC family transcriptional regulator